MSTVVTSTSITIQGATPKISLDGTEGSNKQLSLKESAGTLILYDEDGAANRTIWSGTTGRRTTPLITQDEVALLTVTSLADQANTLTAAQLTGTGKGIGLFDITLTGAQAQTTDTAANIVGVFDNAAVGTWFMFALIEDGAFNATVTAGAGVSTLGNMVVNNTSGLFLVRLDNVTASSEAVTVYRIG